MKLTELFKAALKELHQAEYRFAIAGGFAADLYRKQPRGTADIDFLFFVEGSSVNQGKDILKRLGLGAGEVKLHQLTRSPKMNKKTQETYMLVGRTKKEEDAGVDLLLPPFPWFANALLRAQLHLVDFGFGPTPTITAEDLILSKLYANRPKDLDDIISIFESGYPLDFDYLVGEMERLSLNIPKEAIYVAPIALRSFSKRQRRAKKSFP